MKILFVLIVTCLANCAFAQSNPDSLVQLYAEKIGGKAEWEKIKSFKIEMTGKSGHRKAKVENYMLKPYCFKMVFHFTSGKRTLSYDGETGFIKDGEKMEDMPLDMQIEMREEPDFFDELIFYKEKEYGLEFLQDTTINSKIYAKLALMKSEDDTQYYYLNTTSHLIEIVEEYSAEKKYEGVLFKTTFPDHQHIGNILFPKTMGLYGNDKLMVTYEINKVIINPDLRAGDFNSKQ